MNNLHKNTKLDKIPYKTPLHIPTKRTHQTNTSWNEIRLMQSAKSNKKTMFHKCKRYIDSDSNRDGERGKERERKKEGGNRINMNRFEITLTYK